MLNTINYIKSDDKYCSHFYIINIIPSYLFKKNKELRCNKCNIILKQFYLCVSCGEIYCINKCIKIHIEKKDDNLNHKIFLFINTSKKEIKFYCFICKSFFSNFNISLKILLQLSYEQYLNLYDCNLLTKKEIFDIKYKNFLFLLKEKFKNIIFMVGAGISTTAGIPDFRSNNGLFTQLQEKYNLISPEDFFNIFTFRKNPLYFYEFSKYFDLSKTKPTLTHKFMNFLSKEKKIVKYIFTQNIDGLELKAKISDKKIIFSHGNFLNGHCSNCKKNIDIKLINKGIEDLKIVYCDICKSPCKPNIVFYGEDLPPKFYEKIKDLKDVDCCIIMGSSLKVYPFAKIPELLKKDTWIICINKERIGNFNYNNLYSNSLMFENDTTDNYLKKILKDIEWNDDFKNFCLKEYGDKNIYKEIKYKMLSIDNKNKKNEIDIKNINKNFNVENKSDISDEDTFLSKENINK